jgi:hypothetical protein
MIINNQPLEIPENLDVIKGCGTRLTLGGVIVRIHLRFEPILATVAVISYTPHCSVRCANVENDMARLAWAKSIAVQLVDEVDDREVFEEAVTTLDHAASEYARAIRKNLFGA